MGVKETIHWDDPSWLLNHIEDFVPELHPKVLARIEQLTGIKFPNNT